MNRAPCIALALGALLAGAAGVRAGDQDDIEALKKQLERSAAELSEAGKILDELERKSREEYAAKGYSCFVDQSHWVRTKYLEPGWSVPMNPYASTFGKVIADGIQAVGVWSSGKPATPERQVTARIHRYAHVVPGSKTAAPGATKVDPAGAAIPHADPLLMLKELHRVAMEQLEPPPAAPPAPAPGKPAPEVDPEVALRLKDAKACQAPTRKGVGVMKFYAAAQGTLKAAPVRTRTEWYAWSGKDSVYKGKDVTWILTVRFDQSTLDNNRHLALGRDFADAVATY